MRVNSPHLIDFQPLSQLCGALHADSPNSRVDVACRRGHRSGVVGVHANHASEPKRCSTPHVIPHRATVPNAQDEDPEHQLLERFGDVI